MKQISTFADMTEGKCYERVFVGAPKIGYPFNRGNTEPLMEGYGDCIMLRTHGTKRKDADLKDPFILFVQRNERGHPCERHVTNINDLSAAVVQRGFKKVETIDWTALPRTEQLEKAARADIMVQPHGQGLGWMSVMRKGGVVIELSIANPNDYAAWATWNNISYVKVQAERNGTLSNCEGQIGRGASDDPMLVPVDRFMVGLDRALSMA